MPPRQNTGRTPINRDLELTRLMDGLQQALDAATALDAHMVIYLIDNAIHEVRDVVIPQKP